MSKVEKRAAVQTSEEIRGLRIRTHQAGELLNQAHEELRDVMNLSERYGLAGNKFSRKLEEMLTQLGKLATRPSLAADAFEQDHYSAAPETPTAAQLIVGGGNVPEPNAHALGLLLDLVDGGSSEALDFENDLSRLAFVWLMRRHPPAVEQIRKLAEIAGEVNSDHIKWAGKWVE